MTKPGANDDAGDAGRWKWASVSPAKMMQGLGFGLIFGFLLQKGGVAKFDILIGVLLLENFVVVQVMLSAIVVGMIGVHLMERRGLLQLSIKETVFGSNVIGGLVFGAGFGLLAYCPGTNAAAVGQGNIDAVVGIGGMVFGSYLFALSSRFTEGTVTKRGERGELVFPELLGVPRGLFIAFAAPGLTAVLIAIEVFLAR